MTDPTPADIPSLVAKTRAIADVVRNAGGAALYRKDLPDLDAVADALDALSPKEAELVKPPREYEVSGDAVEGGEEGEHKDRIERLLPPFYIRWTSGPNYERAYLCVEDGEPDMCEFAEVSFGMARLFKAGLLAAVPLTASHDAARERIARIIDPVPFDAGPNSISAANDRRVLLAKADAILAALPTTDGAGDDVAEIRRDLRYAEACIAARHFRSALATITEIFPPDTRAGKIAADALAEKLTPGFAATLSPATDASERMREARITKPARVVDHTTHERGTEMWSEVITDRPHNSQIAHCADKEDAELIAHLVNAALAPSNNEVPGDK